MTPNIDSLALITLSMRFFCVGILIQSIELLWLWRDLGEGRLLDWQADRGRLVGPNGSFRWLFRQPATLVVLSLRVGACAVCMVLPLTAPMVSGALFLLLASQAYYNHRFRIIHQGADTMFLLGLAAVAIASLDPRNPLLLASALCFLALEVLLAYFMAGWDKLKSFRWRSGNLLPLILRDSMHRFPLLGNTLASRKSFAVLASWSVILLELLFPLCLILPAPALVAVLLSGIVFHLTVSITMGLHGFFWSFVGAYPAIYFSHVLIGTLLAR